MEHDEPSLMNTGKLGGGGRGRSTKKTVLRTLINWARKIPGFNDLKNEDQVRLKHTYTNTHSVIAIVFC